MQHVETNDELEQTPAEIVPWITRARSLIQEHYGIDPDMGEASTSLLDALLRDRALTQEANARHELITAVGCYFGEVARRQLNGRWILVADNPSHWRVELLSCSLHFSPVGMTGECVFGCTNADYDGTFTTRECDHEALKQRLDQSPPLSDEEYHTLGGRLEVLTLVTDWLIAQKITSGG